MGKLKPKPYKWWLDKLGEQDGLETDARRVYLQRRNKSKGHKGIKRQYKYSDIKRKNRS